jgi:carboxyl-terminal processing protease
MNMRLAGTKMVFLTLGLVLCLVGFAQSETDNPYAESFDMVWNTINERFFDPEFKGVDWAECRERYRPGILTSESVDEFYVGINTMLFELGVSHLGVVPTDDPKQLGEATVFGEATVGLDVRLVEGRLLITRVEDDSPAAEAGLLTGYEILSLNNRTLGEITADYLEFPTPPFSERNERYMILEEVYWELMGPLAGRVHIEFRDYDGDVSTTTLDRRSRGAQCVFDEGMPPTYVTFSSRRIGKDFGYIRFNSFHPDVLDDFASAMDELADTRGLIIDLRGNPGGAFAVRSQMAAKFVAERTLIWRYRGRGGVDDIYLDPSEEPYTHPLAILIDGTSASSSEEFSGGLQFIGRATVVGERTPGRDVVMDVTVLPVGAYFVFPVAETMTSNGTVLEYRGVLPDVESLFSAKDLKEGRDVQLEAALKVLQDTYAR